MENFTQLLISLFVLACFGLAWAAFMTAAKGAITIASGAVAKRFTVSFYPQMWVGSLSFTYIMGYIFVL